MRLSDNQVGQYHDKGYVLLPRWLDVDEINLLRREADTLFAQVRPEVSSEGSGVPRTAFAPHLYSEVYSALVRHPRLAVPAIQLLGEDAYLNQVKLHAIAAYDGKGFNWHQDYGTAWKLVDAMPSDRALSVAVFIDDMKVSNSPLLVIPGSHRYGSIDAVENTATDRPRFVPDRAIVTELAGASGIEVCSGEAGSVLIFHCNLVHGSSNNITPWHRKAIYISYAAMSNKTSPDENRLPWVALRNWEPVAPLDDDCLKRLVGSI